MNCPQCKEMVGGDQFRYGDWQHECDAAGLFVRCWRWLFVFCDFCGAFRVATESDGHGGDRVLRIYGPFRGTRQAANVPQLAAVEST